MKSILAIFLATASTITYANTTTVTVDEIEGGGYTAYHYNNTSQTTPEIHVIGVYEAYTSSSPRNNAPGTAVINVTGTSNIPVDLVLSAYVPTHWILEGTGAQYIHSVLLNGYYASSVTGLTNGNIINKTGSGNYLVACAFRWPSDNGGCNTQGLVSQVAAIYGAPISTFSGAYGATKFTVALSPIPEPSTFALMGLGLATIVGISRAKRRQQGKA